MTNIFDLPDEIIHGEITKHLNNSEQILLGQTCKWFFNGQGKDKKLNIRDFVSNVQLFKYALDSGYVISEETSKIVAQYGCAEVLELLSSMNKLEGYRTIYRYALIGDNLDTLNWLHSIGYSWKRYVSDSTQNTSLGMLKWLYETTEI